MEILTISGNSAAADTDGYANDVNTTSGLPFTLAATVPGDDLAHLVIITPSGSVTGNYTITGTGPQGEAQTETLATDTTNAVTSAKYYKSVTSVLAPSGIGANTVDIGWTAVSVSAWKVIPSFGGYPIGVGVTVVSGSPTYTLQHTHDGTGVFNHATIASKTTSFDGGITTPVRAIRLSWAAAGSLALSALMSRRD